MSEKSDEKKIVRYVALSQGTWGSGETQEEAIKNLRSAGFSGRIQNRVFLFIMPPGSIFGGVDNFGIIHWTWEDWVPIEKRLDIQLAPVKVKL